MSALIQSGKLLGVGKENQVTDTFKKRMFWLEHGDNPQYPQITEFQLSQDKTTIIDLFKVGDSIDVSFNLRGKKWINKEGNGVIFNTLDAWQIKKADNNQQAQVEAPRGDDSDLPF